MGGTAVARRGRAPGRRSARLRPLLAAVLAALLACALATACTTEVAGRPAAPTGVLLPPRPREVRLDGVDPCSLLTPEQRAELGLTSEPKTHKSTSSFFRGDVTACTIRGPYPDVVLLGVSTVTTAGIERWSEGDVAATLRPMSVAGFPAVVAKPDRFADYCNVEVDVAPGQLLDVQFGSGSVKASIPQDELCARAVRSAELLATTLLAS